MTRMLAQRLNGAGNLQTQLEFSEDIPTNLGSGYFDGSGAHMEVTSGLSDFAVGLGDFTVEWYQNIAVQRSYPRIWSIGSYSFGPVMAISINNEGRYMDFKAMGSTRLFVTVNLPTGQWDHFALVRYAGTTTIYQNGISLGSSVDAYDVPTNVLNLWVGNESPPDFQPFDGYITNLQWVTGTALYTGNFNPPAMPLSPAENSKLLLLFGSEANLTKDSSGTNKTVVNYGATWSANTDSPVVYQVGISNTTVKANTLDEVTLAPNILSTDLWAWFDATNPASYPGGVIWLDISGNGFYGIMNLVSPPSHVNPGLYFNGFSSSINTSISNPGSVPISMSFWVKPTNPAHMWGIYDSAPGQPHVLRQINASTPTNTAEWWDGDPVVSTGLTPGVWQYLTVNYHATTGFRSVDTYVNGQLVQSGTGSPYIYYAWSTYNLGVINDNTNWYEGYMAEVQIYHRKPSVDEIAWNYSVGALKYGLTPSIDVYRNQPPGPTVSQPMSSRMIDDGTLQVKGEFDEVSLAEMPMDGLTLWLDASSTASYPGTGTTWYDISGNGHDVTLVNGASLVGNAINFDYSLQQYGSLPATNMFTGDLTAMGWVYVRSYLSWSRLFDFGNGAAVNNVLIAVTSGSSGYPVYSTGTNLNSGTQLPLNQWVQLTATQSGTVCKLYIDGALVAAGTGDAIPAVTRIYNYIGRSNWPGDAYLDGKIASLAMWDRAFSEIEVDELYWATIPGERKQIVQAGLQMWLDAGDPASYPGTGTTWYDLTDSGYDATLISNVLFNDGYFYNMSDGNYIQSNNFPLPGLGDFTYSLWVRYDNVLDDSTLLEIDCPGFSFLVRSPYVGHPVYINSVDTQFAIGFGQPLLTNEWYNIVVTRSSYVIRAYINTVEGNSTGTITNDISGGSPSLTLGKLQVSSGQWLRGDLAVFASYDRALDAEEIQQNFNAYKQRFGL